MLMKSKLIIATTILLASAASAEAAKGGQTVFPGNDPSTWFTPKDYPEDLKPANVRGVTNVELFIDDHARPFNCRIVQTSGNARLDKMSCELLFARARFMPAQDAKGAAIPGAFAMPVIWSPDKNRPAPVMATDVTLTVNHLPDPKNPVMMLKQIEREDGTVESCASFMPAKPALEQIACQQVSALAREDPMVDAQGKHLRAMRMRRVTFEVASAQPTQ
jgi:hypothetical protein